MAKSISTTRAASISRLQPLYLYLLVDSSGSMSEDGGFDSMNRTKATVVMDAAAEVLQEAYMMGLSGNTYKNYIYVSATGYQRYEDVAETHCLFNFKENTPSMVRNAAVLSISDFIQCGDKQNPILIDPKGQTPMRAGFQKAKADILSFDEHCHELVTAANPGMNVSADAVKPHVVILHCTDGRFDNCNGGAELNIHHENSPEKVIDEIKNLKFKHISEVTIVNLYLSSSESEESIIFPSENPDKGENPFLNFLYGISSELTPGMIQAAATYPEFGVLKPGAKALAYNIDSRDLYKLFSLGTQITRPSITAKNVTEN